MVSGRFLIIGRFGYELEKILKFSLFCILSKSGQGIGGPHKSTPP